MKAILLSAVLVLVGGMANASEPTEKVVSVNVHEAFFPGNFDATSDVYVVVSGMFPNSCYRWSDASVNHDKARNIHEVHSTAIVNQGMCLMVLVPFQKEVRLGVLGRGEHKVRFMNGDGTYLEKMISLE